MKTLLIFDLMYFSTWPIGGHSKQAPVKRCLPSNKILVRLFLLCRLEAWSLKTHFGRFYRKSLDSASAVTPARFLRNSSRVFFRKFDRDGNRSILRGLSSPGISGEQSRWIPGFWFSNVGDLISVEPNHDKSCCYHPRLPQEHQMGRCYVFIYFTSKNSWRCLTWGVTLLLMWHALQIRALGWIKVVQGGLWTDDSFFQCEGHFANPQPLLRLLCGGWKGWILIYQFT